ncbi:rad52-like protein [Gongronella butleri]|nr:rad52-like protein [Gongronella butleri]
MDPKDRHEYLKKSLGPEFVSRRPGPGGTDISYISGHSAINLANEVFGYDGWSSEVRETKVDFEDIDSDGRISVGMASKVRVTLACGAFREDWGSGAAENMRNKAAAFDKARKSSTTDGLKRALHLFGNMLGNCLYDKNYLQSIRSVPRPMVSDKGKKKLRVQN